MTCLDSDGTLREEMTEGRKKNLEKEVLIKAIHSDLSTML